MQLELFVTIKARVYVDTERWKDVVGFPCYEVSSMGNFRRKSDLFTMRGTIAHNGYKHIGLSRDGRQVTKLAHRLVAETWLDKRAPSCVDVNHINKIRDDNRVANLEWTTRSENIKHAYAYKKS